MDRVDDARATYTEATKLCKDSIPLWLLLADLEVIVEKISMAVIPCELCCDYNDYNATCDKVSAGNVTKARSVVEKGRLRNPGNELLWMKAVSCKTFSMTSFHLTLMSNLSCQVKMEAEAGLPDIAKTVLARALQVSNSLSSNHSSHTTCHRNAPPLASCGLSPSRWRRSRGGRLEAWTR